MDSLAFLDRAGKNELQAVYVLHGDEDFLKRQVRVALRSLVLGSGDDAYGLSAYPGDKADWAAIQDELHTLPFLNARRLVVVDNADPFVTRFRASLEKYVTEPAKTGVLVLDVKTWPANTRLAKLVDSAATIVCKAPAAHRLPDWCVRWTASQHQKQLVSAAAQLLVSLVGPDMGQLQQEIEKLAIYVGSSNRINSDDVDRLVGASRMENTWKIFDAIAVGQAGDALSILGRLFDQGEDAMRMLGAFSMQLRRLAQAARLAGQGMSLNAALQEVGVPPFAHRGCEQQIRHLGKPRLDRLYDWLVQVDLGLKGSSPLPPRILLEQLVVRLAQKG